MVDCLISMNKTLSLVLKCNGGGGGEEVEEEEEEVSLTEFCSTMVFIIDSQHFNHQ